MGKKIVPNEITNINIKPNHIIAVDGVLFEMFLRITQITLKFCHVWILGALKRSSIK